MSEGKLTYKPLGEAAEITLSREIVKKHIIVPTKSGKMPSDQEVTQFMMLCQARQLNPFTGDAFIVGYDSKAGPNFSIITAKSALDKRAESHPEFDGYESGLVLSSKDGIEYRDGAICLKEEWPKVIGAWAKVYRKDRNHASKHEINREVYDTKRSRWAIDPCGMLIKCAEAGALRKAFPNEFAGLYLEEEMHNNEPKQAKGSVIEDNGNDKPKPKGLKNLPPSKRDNTDNQDAPTAQSDATTSTDNKVEEETSGSPSLPGELEALLQLFEKKGMPREFLIQTIQLVGIAKKAKELSDLTAADIEKISSDTDTILEVYEAEVAG